MTSTTELQIGDGFSLPAEDFLEAATGIIGKRGRGKSGLVKVTLEELVRVGLPFVAFDPVGIMWGLRSSSDGLGVGLPVLVVGGSHGDLPLERQSGARIAKAVVEANCSVILDFSDEPKTVYREFIRDFAHELYRLNDTPRVVIVEEAPELVPQRLRPDMAPVFEAVERLVSRGRNKGLGVILVSQRAATINKDVLSQVDALFVMGLTAPQDRKALGEWIEDKGDPSRTEEFFGQVAALGRQEAFFWSPEAFGGRFTRLRVRNFSTFHPDKTHLRRMGMLAVRPVMTDVRTMAQQVREALDAPTATRPKVRVAPVVATPRPSSEITLLPRSAPVTRHPAADQGPETGAGGRAPARAARTAGDGGRFPASAVDIVLRSPVAEVRLERPVAKVTIEESTPVGKVLTLLVEGWLDLPRTQGDIRAEIRKRYGIDYNANGGMWKTLRGALEQCLEPGWGFLVTEGTGKSQTFTRSEAPRGKLYSEDV